MSRKMPESEPIRSDFDGDPAMQDLVDLFATEMPKKAAMLSALFEGHQINDLQRLTHQLKGAASGYGFGPISEAAAELESALRSPDELEQVRSQVEQLIDLCQRAQSASE